MPSRMLRNRSDRATSAQATTAVEQATLKAGEADLTYLYDFGDNWEHSIGLDETCEAEPGQLYPRLTNTAGTCPPEDTGGPLGFEMFVAVMVDPEHPEHKYLKDWYGGTFDPNTPATDELRLDVLKPAKHWMPQNRAVN